MVKMTIYYNSPIFLQNIFTSVQGYLYKRQRNGRHYKKFMDYYANFDYTNKALLKTYQEKELQRLLKFAVKHSAFYKKYYEDIDLDKIKTVNDLKRLPILDKETVRQNLDDMYTIKEKEGVVSHTSGTTGKALKYIHTYEGIQLRNAFLDDFKRKHGFINGQMKKASFNASEIIPTKQKAKIFWRDNYAMKQRLYSSYHTKGENIAYYIENLNAYKPAALDGYPSTLYEIAKYINKHNIALDFQPIAIFPTAETLLPRYRQTIEKAFNCKVYNQYASSEGAPFVVECKEGHLHYNMLSGVIEQTAAGEMLITSFMNDGTPLIRYRIGDTITFDDPNKACACGSGLPLVEELNGRTGDYIQTISHGKVTTVFLSLLSEDFNNSILGMQYIQNQKGHVLVKVVPDENYTIHVDEAIRKTLSYAIGEEMEIEIQKVNEIEKDKSGKFRFVINHLV